MPSRGVLFARRADPRVPSTASATFGLASTRTRAAPRRPRRRRSGSRRRGPALGRADRVRARVDAAGGSRAGADGAPTSAANDAHAPVAVDAVKAWDFCHVHARQNLALAAYLGRRVPPAYLAVVPYEALLRPETATLFFDDLRAKVGLPRGGPYAPGPPPRPCRDRVSNWDALLAGPRPFNRTVWRRMCETEDRVVADAWRYGPAKEFYRGFDEPAPTPTRGLAKPAPNRGLAKKNKKSRPKRADAAPAGRAAPSTTPSTTTTAEAKGTSLLARDVLWRHGFFDGEFPLVIRQRGARRLTPLVSRAER